MKKFLVLSVLFLAMQSPALAETAVRVAPKAVWFSYHEQIMDETGLLAGVGLRLEHHTKRGLLLGIESEILAGSLHYDGHYSDGGGVELDTNDLLSESTAYVGWEWTTGTLQVVPYAGIRFRYWRDDLIHRWGYLREITQWYLPVGLRVTRGLGSGWSLSVAGEGSLLLQGTVRSRLSDAGSEYGDAENEQRFASGYGAKLSAGLLRRFDHLSVGIEPYLQWYEVGRSRKDTVLYGDKTGQVVEPYNNTFMAGIGIVFLF
jgi:hypothetical protein